MCRVDAGLGITRGRVTRCEDASWLVMSGVTWWLTRIEIDLRLGCDQDVTLPGHFGHRSLCLFVCFVSRFLLLLVSRVAAPQSPVLSPAAQEHLLQLRLHRCRRCASKGTWGPQQDHMSDRAQSWAAVSCHMSRSKSSLLSCNRSRPASLAVGGETFFFLCE